MIEGIAAIGAVTAFTPSAAYGSDRRQKRLKWLSSLRAALDEAGPLIDEMGADGEEVACTRAQIADALGVVEEMRTQIDGGRNEAAGDASGRTITATELAQRIAASAERSIAVQAHIGAAAVRRYVDGQNEHPR